MYTFAIWITVYFSGFPAVLEQLQTITCVDKNLKIMKFSKCLLPLTCEQLKAMFWNDNECWQEPGPKAQEEVLIQHRAMGFTLENKAQFLYNKVILKTILQRNTIVLFNSLADFRI